MYETRQCWILFVCSLWTITEYRLIVLSDWQGNASYLCNQQGVQEDCRTGAQGSFC